MSGEQITATCTTCDGAINWIECPTGGWWAHEAHPVDHHDAAASIRVIEEIDDHGYWFTRGVDSETASTMPGEAPPGMDPATRRGQSQARDLTGPGRWPDITTTSHREDTEPMNDITDPTHRIESKIEQQMRSDFMHAWGAYPDNPEEYDPANSVEYAEYADPWLAEERWAMEWDYLSDATLRWTDDRAESERRLALLQDCGLLSRIEQRSEEQARYIAEHGIERDEARLLTSHYVTRVREREASAAGTPSALADYRPGNALSAHTEASERDGIDR
ncbi:hypothetical protein [Nocardia sp. CC227C]|uniref:hypothetical protein n=1 Tax=Nocardia sp. CC227C TaxID=3044562 RepID=UPI00278C4829|nr:hypothetical protein [Nocardia sp. CC227C]